MVHLYATFGRDSMMKDKYVSITAPSQEAARKAMNSSFIHWSSLYTQEEFEPLQLKYGYSLLATFELGEEDA